MLNIIQSFNFFLISKFKKKNGRIEILVNFFFFFGKYNTYKIV